MNKLSILETLDRNDSRGHKIASFVEKGGYASIRDGFAGHPKSPAFESGASTARKVPDDDARKPKEYLPPELRGSDTHTDPTATAAVQALNYGDAARDARRLTKILQAVDNLYAEAEQIVDRHTPRDPGLFDQAQSDVPEPGCQSCARVEGPGSVGLPKARRVPWWNPVHITATLDGKEVDCCRWCWEGEVGVKRTGTLPDVLDLVAYRDTGRARRKGA